MKWPIILGLLYLMKFCNNSFFLWKLQPSPRIFTYCVLIATTLNNLPRFFEFQLIFDEKGTDYWTSDINEDPRYITMSSYNELITTGFFPLLALCYYNYKIYARMKLSCNIDLGRYVGGKFVFFQKDQNAQGRKKHFFRVGCIFNSISIFRKLLMISMFPCVFLGSLDYFWVLLCRFWVSLGSLELLWVFGFP